VGNDWHRRCPRCERALVDGPDGPRCLYCGYDFSVSPDELDQGMYFAAGETAILGLLAGLQIGAALGLVVADPVKQPSILAVAAGFGALIGGLFGGGVGRYLAWQWRSKFRLLLLAACTAGIVVLSAAVAGWMGVETVLLGAVGVTALIYLIGCRAARQHHREGKAGNSHE